MTLRGILILWLSLVLAACAMPPKPLPPAASSPEVLADLVVVEKQHRVLSLFHQGRVLRQYEGLQLGGQPYGHKQFEGDGRTPEGRYVIDARNPYSGYHLSLRISYPGPQDVAHAARHGRPPGGDIFIHGQPNGWSAGERVPGDWTDGCIALANAEMEELWRLVPDGTPIAILP